MGNKKRKNNRNNKKNKYKKQQQLAARSEREHHHAEKLQDYEVNPEILKRKFSDSDDDLGSEHQPKRKKKQPVVTSNEPGKGQKSIRQMKREKHAQRQADAQAAAKDELKSQCISYLSQWKHDKQNWKFMKAKQVWLYKNKFSAHLVPDSSWQTLLEYFESAQGNIRNMLLEDANKVIKKMDEWTESQNTENSKGESKADNTENANEEVVELEKPDDVSYKRARDLLQCLQE